MGKKVEIEETNLKKGRRKKRPDKKNNRNSFWMKNNQRNLKIAIFVIIFLILVAVVGVAIYFTHLLDKPNYDTGENYSTPKDEYTLADEENFDAMHDVSDANSLNEMLRQWATNDGEKMHSDNILNVLLLGLDSKDGKQSYARSDTMILVSVNKATKEVVLTSFFRDSYSYMKYGDTETYAKLNAAFFYGGPKAIIETIENNYKIEIDNYVSVDFKTFPQLIDALGGVNVEVQEYEKNFINRTTKYTIESGKSVNLSGNEALVFSRIRYSDSDGDVSRTRRQRQVIQAIIDSAEGASISQINKALNTVLPYVTTDIKKGDIVSLAAQALTQDWMNYPRIQQTMPTVTTDEENPVPITGWDAYINGQSVWVVDYPMAAYNLQKSIYGKSNIIISDDRRSAQDLLSSRNIQDETTYYNNYTSYQTTTQQYYYEPESTTYSTTLPEESTTQPITDDPTSTTEPIETTLPPSTEPETSETTTSDGGFFWWQN